MNQKWSLLIDNARIHYYWKFKNYINKCGNINIIYNVPYSPESNPIEKVFKEIKNNLKNESINNHNIERKIIRSFNIVKNENIINYFKKSINFY
jgi:hypothetical protein